MKTSDFDYILPEELIAQNPGVVLLQGRCFEREAVPFKAFDGLVDSLSRLLRSLTPDDSRMLMPRHAALLLRLFPVLGRVTGGSFVRAHGFRYSNRERKVRLQRRVGVID